MRIAASTPTALTIRHPKIAPETVEAAAPPTAKVPAPSAPPPAYLARYGTPDAGFVMQLIATAAQTSTHDDAVQPAISVVSTAYGSARRATLPDNRVIRSI
ncbi:MAG: hypothetical protein J0H25_02820 [Rhizobiales bacterium]|nr:hypothetical protein [Hyphomicrobiales bacterium]MBN9011982.1 hypothetical protein [Hyphomicrobiales bacterium]